jgi:hypothetical protein
MGENISGASSIQKFAKRNNVSQSSAYKEIRAGRLLARKVGRRTIIFDEDERAWRDNLPKLKTAKEN